MEDESEREWSRKVSRKCQHTGLFSVQSQGYDFNKLQDFHRLPFSQTFF